jgi:hypothetical protein
MTGLPAGSLFQLISNGYQDSVYDSPCVLSRFGNGAYSRIRDSKDSKGFTYKLTNKELGIRSPLKYKRPLHKKIDMLGLVSLTLRETSLKSLERHKAEETNPIKKELEEHIPVSGLSNLIVQYLADPLGVLQIKCEIYTLWEETVWSSPHTVKTNELLPFVGTPNCDWEIHMIGNTTCREPMRYYLKTKEISLSAGAKTVLSTRPYQIFDNWEIYSMFGQHIRYRPDLK